MMKVMVMFSDRHWETIQLLPGQIVNLLRCGCGINMRIGPKELEPWGGECPKCGRTVPRVVVVEEAKESCKVMCETCAYYGYRCSVGTGYMSDVMNPEDDEIPDSVLADALTYQLAVTLSPAIKAGKI